MCPPPARHGRSPDASLDRRGFLAVASSGLAVALAGCSAVVDYVADLALGDVNAFNATDGRLRGSLAVTDPNGDSVLDERFDLRPEESDGATDTPDEDDDSATVFRDVFTDPGPYEVRVELDGSDALDAVTSTEETVAIADTDEKRIAVVFGAGDAEEPILVTAFEDFSDLNRYRAARTES